MSRKITEALLLVFPLLALTGCAKEDQLSCPPPSGTASVAFQNVPLELLDSLMARVGEVVPPGEDFDATDVVETGRHRRFAFFWTKGMRWVVATELGGVGYSNPTFGFDLYKDGRGVRFVAERTAFPETLCETALDLLNSLALEPCPRESRFCFME